MTPSQPPLPAERWYTLAECASQLGKSVSWTRRLIVAHHLPRKYRRKGRHPRLIMWISYQSLEVLRQLD